jgi:hypothetical protein
VEFEKKRVQTEETNCDDIKAEAPSPRRQDQEALEEKLKQKEQEIQAKTD